MRIYILALEGVFDLGLAAFMDVLGTASELAGEEPTQRMLDVTIVGVRTEVRTGQGLSVPVRLAAELPQPDLVLVPALSSKMPEGLAKALDQPDVAEAGQWLRCWSQSGATIAAACTGTFVVAEAGLLNGHSATTSWWLSAFFRHRYPLVLLDEERMLVCSDPFVTAGAAMAHFDLGLHVVSRQSPTLAALCARYLLIETRPSQAAFIIPDHIAHTDPIVQRFEQWARDHLESGFSSAAAAATIGVSERTLVRRIQQVLGKSPLAWFQDLRVDYAVHLLQTTDSSVEQIASRVGYADGTTLRTLLRRKLGQGIRELRQRATHVAVL
ncbi:GlxA family transcriptional regulator [Pseudomonas sp. O230]|uniref:GlxA family transcriptional regulator n=1 Tax=Pseudomonas sp. O230 TaxID=3159450 RepID=UPI00387B4189